jgi:hypothetical protein
MGVRKSLALGVWLLAQALGCYEICHDIRSNSEGSKFLYFLVALAVAMLFTLSALSMWKFINTHPGVVPVDWDTYVKNKNTRTLSLSILDLLSSVKLVTDLARREPTIASKRVFASCGLIVGCTSSLRV